MNSNFPLGIVTGTRESLRGRKREGRERRKRRRIFVITNESRAAHDSSGLGNEKNQVKEPKKEAKLELHFFYCLLRFSNDTNKPSWQASSVAKKYLEFFQLQGLINPLRTHSYVFFSVSYVLTSEGQKKGYSRLFLKAFCHTFVLDDLSTLFLASPFVYIKKIFQTNWSSRRNCTRLLLLLATSSP